MEEDDSSMDMTVKVRGSGNSEYETEEQEQEEEETEALSKELAVEEDVEEEAAKEKGPVSILKTEVKTISEVSVHSELDEKDLQELMRSNEPSYTNISAAYSRICEMRLAVKMTELRKMLKDEITKIIAEQTSAFESHKVRRLYKAGIELPERIFEDDAKAFTYKELERLRFLMTHDIF